VRKDVLGFFLIVSLVVLSYGKDSFNEVLKKRDKLVQLERKLSQLRSQVAYFRKLKEEKKVVYSPKELALLLERDLKNFPECRFRAGKREKRDGGLFYVPTTAKCFVPDWETALKVTEKLKEYPIAIASYKYAKGSPSVLTLNLNVYGVGK